MICEMVLLCAVAHCVQPTEAELRQRILVLNTSLFTKAISMGVLQSTSATEGLTVSMTLTVLNITTRLPVAAVTVLTPTPWSD